MKKLKVITCFFVLVSMALLSCTEKQRAQKALEEGIASMQSELPIDMGELGQLTEMVYDDGVLTFSYKFSDAYMSILQSIDKGTLKESFLSGISQSSSKTNIIKKIVDANASMVINLKNTDNMTILSLDISHSELADIEKKIENGEQIYSAKSMMKAQIASMKPKLPIQIQNGLSLVDAEVQGSTVCYSYKLDTDIESVDESAIEESRQEVVKSLKRLYESMIPGFIKENIKFRYLYYNMYGSMLYQIDIDSNELQ